VKARENLLMVGNAFHPEAIALSVTQTVEQALATVDRVRGAWPVIDVRGLVGMVTLEQLEAARAAGAPVSTGELAQTEMPHLHADESLDYAMRRIAESGLKVLPVVSRENARELKGTVSVSDILQAYGIGRARQAEAAAANEGTIPGKRVFAIATAVLIVLGILAGVVNYGLGAERTARAERYYQAGNRLFALERYDEAIEQYRNALSISHTFDRRLALGVALAKAGRPGEAMIYLEEARAELPTNGPANLAVAEILAQQGRTDRAITLFQRAIYGTWPASQQGQRVRARMELVDALAKSGQRDQSVAELLAVGAEMPGDAGVQRQVAQRLSALGKHDRAAEVYAGLAKRDSSAYGQLGEEELAIGDLGAACAAFRSGLLADRLSQCEQMQAVYPMEHGLAASERLRRSQELLAAVQTDLAQCTGTPVPVVPQPGKRTLSPGDAADANLALASDLWQQRLSGCSIPPSPDAALTRVMGMMKR
jgi:tetratricopeptide (TPR) repeat protein/CBS domain-containing protein